MPIPAPVLDRPFGFFVHAQDASTGFRRAVRIQLVANPTLLPAALGADAGLFIPGGGDATQGAVQGGLLAWVRRSDGQWNTYRAFSPEIRSPGSSYNINLLLTEPENPELNFERLLSGQEPLAFAVINPQGEPVAVFQRPGQDHHVYSTD